MTMITKEAAARAATHFRATAALFSAAAKAHREVAGHYDDVAEHGMYQAVGRATRATSRAAAAALLAYQKSTAVWTWDEPL